MEDPLLVSESKNARKEIREESNDTYNRLHSIAEDAAFVSQLARAYPQFKLYRRHITSVLNLKYLMKEWSSQFTMRGMVR